MSPLKLVLLAKSGKHLTTIVVEFINMNHSDVTGMPPRSDPGTPPYKNYSPSGKT